jgi:undecaprenyl-diphosphatase
LRVAGPHVKLVSPPVHDLDVQTFLAIYGGAHGALAPLMTAVTLVGEGWSALLLLPLIWSSRTRRFALLLTAAVASQAVLVWALKALTGRVRPWIALHLPAPVMTPHDFSFPSGHASGAFCLAAFLAVALPAAWPRAVWRVRVATASIFLYAGLVAASRVYLGAHFPGDVAAGSLLGGAIGLAAGLAYARRAPAPMVEVEEAAESG